MNGKGQAHDYYAVVKIKAAQQLHVYIPGTYQNYTNNLYGEYENSSGSKAFFGSPAWSLGSGGYLVKTTNPEYTNGALAAYKSSEPEWTWEEKITYNQTLKKWIYSNNGSAPPETADYYYYLDEEPEPGKDFTMKIYKKEGVNFNIAPKTGTWKGYYRDIYEAKTKIYIGEIPKWL